MNTEQAIYQIKHCYNGCGRLNSDNKDFIDIVVSALRAQQERENPKPLTVEELKEREGKPVWVCGVWHVIADAGSKFVRFTDEEWAPSYECGIRWFAYDHEPKEAR